MERQLEGIAGDVEALVWAVGCVWALRVERLIGKFHPTVNCALFLAGLYLGVNYLLTHLAWYGVPGTPAELPPDARRAFAKIGIFIGLCALVGLASPGRPRRRVFAACAFPLLGLLGVWVAAAGIELVKSIGLSASYPTAAAVLRGLAFGFLVAASLSLPAALLYRATATPVAILAFLPAVAKADWAATGLHASPFTPATFFWHVWPFLCAVIFITIFTCICHRWLSRSLDGAGHSPAR
jgi:hypothetical protein